MSKKWDIIKPILELIHRGRFWEDVGQVHAWRSLDELVEVHPQVEDVMDLLHCTTIPSLWRLLRQAQPSLRHSKMTIKADREPKQAQKAAQQILGNIPMVFEEKYIGEHPWARRVLQGGYIFMYKFLQLLRNIYIDAGKAEPQKWLMSSTIITATGFTHRAVSSALIMKSVRFIVVFMQYDL